ncbi:hypothetical protein [Anaerotignum propionicum]|uniref:Uncharacterized protein n=1 Tax=Anaerotignum propionicum DSM 1682 TaxID=991789 RepID=A0ABM5YD42_ANAPI|nr:hypothetical protein [Anaerotignum propionicum]AMJ42084.1 hypothetical protein CPRO_25360 [Anaerotignum propionicum DSM 1682]
MVIFKKIVALITTFVMVVGLAACGGNKVTISVENTNSSDTPKETKNILLQRIQCLRHLNSKINLENMLA